MDQVNDSVRARSATMRHMAYAAMIVGVYVAKIAAADPQALYWPQPAYQPPYQPVAGWARGPMMPGHADSAACGTCADGQCGAAGQGHDRIRHLIDFILYRPQPGCDCCVKTTAYVPPLHAWFPPCCHANGGGCAECGRRTQKHGNGGCATCEGAAGVPLQVGAAKPEIVEPKPMMPPARPAAYMAPSTMVQPRTPQAAGPVVAQRYWMPGIPAAARPAPFTPPASYQQNQSNQAADPYHIQPTQYLPPLPQQR
jgi:hypothetical protein